MSKKQILYSIETKISEKLQQLNMFVYKTTIKNQNFNFNKYFETKKYDFIFYTLELLKIKNPLPYFPIYEKYFKEVYDFSKKNGIDYMKKDISNRKVYFDYWVKNRKKILSEIMEVYKNEK